MKVPVCLHRLEPRLEKQPPHVRLANRTHVQRVLVSVREGVLEPHQPLVDMFRLRGDPIAAVVKAMFRRVAPVQHGVVVALVDYENAVVLECRVELRERAAPVMFLMQVCERIAEAHDSVVPAASVAVQPPPIGLNSLEHQAPPHAVIECFSQHSRRAISRGDIEARFHETHRVKAGTCRHIQHTRLASSTQNLNEELLLASSSRVPVDQFVPLLDEALDVFDPVQVRLSVFERIVAVGLLCKLEFGVSGLFRRATHRISPPCKRFVVAGRDGRLGIEKATRTSGRPRPRGRLEGPVESRLEAG